MRRTLAAIEAIVVTTIVAACAGRADDGIGAQPAAPTRIAVAVENDHWNDVTVYAVRDGVRDRLGTVTALAGETFAVAIGYSAPGEFRLYLDPIGSGEAYLTPPILVEPGQRIELTIGNRLPLSNWVVR